MIKFVFFVFAALGIGALLFGSDFIRNLFSDPAYATIAQVFIGVLSLLAALIGVKWGRNKKQGVVKEEKPQVTEGGISIQGGVRQIGNDNDMNIGHRTNINIGEGRSSNDD